MKKVLCVCIENTSRSPMMAAFLQKELGDGFRVESAGLWKQGHPAKANEHALMCMAERGFDISDHKSRCVDEVNLREFPHIVCMSEREAKWMGSFLNGHNPAILVPNESGGGIPLAVGIGLPAFRKCATLLEASIPLIAEQIRTSLKKPAVAVA